MNSRIAFIISIILGEASVLSGASPQNNTDPEISSLISSVKKGKESTKKKTGLKSDSVIIDWGDNPDIYRMQDSIKEEENIMDILSFVSEAFSAHDYYQSGQWETPEDFSYILSKVTLPDYNHDDFYRPVSGEVTSFYGYRAAFGRVHKGIDLAVNVGDSVRSALPGVVAKVGYDHFGYGHYVVIVHKNGMETRYAHLQRPVATPGEIIEAGEIIGIGGNTGNSTGPHLHFEVRLNGKAINPSTVFNLIRRRY